MSVLITGATGFLGSYVVDILLRETDFELALVTRAKDRDEGLEKLWKALQLHMDGDAFWGFMDRVRFIPGDLTSEGLGISADDRQWIIENAESVLHIAASLNRKSEKACLNQNLRGTLAMLKLAREIQNDHALRRFSFVSTVAMAGMRQGETLAEDEMLRWDLSDYDPYGRTKKFCEHMVHELLPDVPRTIFRPSTVVGDSRFAETTQFDMIRAISFLADLPLVPIDGSGRFDVVNADWVGRCIATLHMKDETEHDTYNLSSGVESPTAAEMGEVISAYRGSKEARFLPRLESPFTNAMKQLGGLKNRKNPAQLVGSLFTVFMPYVTYDTVFDNSRAVDEVGVAPAPWSEFGGRLCAYVKSVNFKYPHRPLPSPPKGEARAAGAEAVGAK